MTCNPLKSKFPVWNSQSCKSNESEMATVIHYPPGYSRKRCFCFHTFSSDRENLPSKWPPSCLEHFPYLPYIAFRNHRMCLKVIFINWPDMFQMKHPLWFFRAHILQWFPKTPQFSMEGQLLSSVHLFSIHIYSNLIP